MSARLKRITPTSPNAYKAALGRYCLLYAMGGIYFDLSMHFHEQLPIIPDKATLFRDLFSVTTYECSNELMYAPKGHELLSLAIEACVRSAREEYYGPFARLAPSCWEDVSQSPAPSRG